MLIIFAFIIIFLLENSYQSFYTKRCLQCPQMKSFQLTKSANTLQYYFFNSKVFLPRLMILQEM